MRPAQLAFVSSQHDWRILSVDGAPARTPSCILVVPGTAVLAREVESVGATMAQACAAALAALAPELAADAANCVCVLGSPANGKRLAFVAARHDIEAWVSLAEARGFHPDMIVPDYSLLPVPQNEEVVASSDGETCIVRTQHGGFACQRDLLPIILGHSAITEADLEAEAVRAVRSGNATRLPNLASAASAASTKSKPRGLVRAALAAAAALIVAAAAPWIEVIRFEQSTASIRKQTEAIAREALPGSARIVNPLGQLREAALPSRTTLSGLTLASALFEGLGRAPGAQLSRLQLDSDGALQASLTTPDASLLQPLRDTLDAQGIVVTEIPGAGSANQLAIDITLRPSP